MTDFTGFTAPIPDTAGLEMRIRKMPAVENGSIILREQFQIRIQIVDTAGQEIKSILGDHTDVVAHGILTVGEITQLRALVSTMQTRLQALLIP